MIIGSDAKIVMCGCQAFTYQFPLLFSVILVFVYSSGMGRFHARPRIARAKLPKADLNG